MGDVVALQVALCVITGLLALCLPTCMAQPLLSRHRMEMWRMSQVLSALPEEMGVERVLVEELSREEEDKGEDLIEQLIRAKGTPAA